MKFRQLLEIASRVECKKTNHKESLGTDVTLQTEGQADRYDLHVRLFFLRAGGLRRARQRIYNDICRRDLDSTESWE